MSGAAGTCTAGTVSGRSLCLGAADFRRIQAMMHEHVGITLHENKKALVEARVRKRLKALRIPDFGAYLEYLAEDESGQELVLLIDVISTNVTHFFRESDHFRFLGEQTHRWLAEGRRTLRFWSAAAASGEEPYSMAITLAEVPGTERADVKILATDISTQVLKQAAAGVYPAKKAERIPAPLRERYFGRLADRGVVRYRAGEELKSLIAYRRLNLSRIPYTIKARFDAIFCRNVMIYFDGDLRDRVVKEAHRLLLPGGFLIVGHAETLIGVNSDFEFLRPSIYRRK